MTPPPHHTMYIYIYIYIYIYLRASEAIVCLFVAVFLLCPWFDQLWGVSLTDPLTPA